jgi:hypothetical protein
VHNTSVNPFATNGLNTLVLYEREDANLKERIPDPGWPECYASGTLHYQPDEAISNMYQCNKVIIRHSIGGYIEFSVNTTMYRTYILRKTLLPLLRIQTIFVRIRIRLFILIRVWILTVSNTVPGTCSPGAKHQSYNILFILYFVLFCII